MRTFLNSKIHGARVTDTQVGYEGSLGIDALLMERAGILPCEKVEIYDITNGERLATYAIPEERGSGRIKVLGAAARKIKRGDHLIIVTYTLLSANEWPSHRPNILRVDKENKPL